MEEGKRPPGLEAGNPDAGALIWTSQPPLGFLRGDYYREETFFAPVFEGAKGYHGILQVVADRGKLVLVEFDEQNSPEYYMRMHQNLSKRYSDYAFFQAGKERTRKTGAVWNNGVCAVEGQMCRENRLTGGFDLLTGASNSVKRSFLPLAEAVDQRMKRRETDGVYYGLAWRREAGVTPRLQVVVKDGKICSCRYDEIFADRAEEIREESQKKYYRQSKYHAPSYESSCAIGFNVWADLLEQLVIQNQSLRKLEQLPFCSGERMCREYESYRELAEELERRMRADGWD